MAQAQLDPFEQAGRDAAYLMVPRDEPGWVHRRVQSLRYLDQGWTEIHLSIDFDLPPDAEKVPWVPVTALPKWPPLYRVDFVDHEGRPIPLLTSRQNGSIDYGLMAALADEIDATWVRDKKFSEALESLTQGPETTLDAAFVELLDSVTMNADPADPRVSRFLDLASSLIDSTLLWYPTKRADGAERTIAKVAYHWPDEINDSPWVRALRSLSWSHPPEWMALPHIGGEANFHLEIEAPAPLLIRDIGEPLFYWILPDDEGDQQSVTNASEDAEKAALRPEQHVACRGNLAHAYVSGRRPGTVDIPFSLAPPRSGFVAASLAASFAIAIFASAMYWSREAVVDSRDAGVALLVLVPAIIGYLVARPSDPAVVRRHLIGVQIVVSLAAAIPVTMGVLLLQYAANPDCLTTSWRVAVAASWLLTIMLIGSVLGAGSRQPQEPEH